MPGKDPLKDLISDKSFRFIVLVLMSGILYILVSNGLIKQWIGDDVEAEIISLITLRSLIFLIVMVGVLYFVQRAFQKAAQKKDDSFWALFRQNHQPMLLYDRNSYRFINVNDAAVRFYGFTFEEFLSMRINDITASQPESNLERRPYYENSGFAKSDVWRHSKKDGELAFVQALTYTVYFDQHDAELVLIYDVTPHVMAERELSEGRELLEANVRQRTAELETLNSILQKQNDEMTRTNEELHIATSKLFEQAEIIKAEREDRFKRILASLNDVVWSFDLAQHKHDYISPNADRIYGDVIEEMASELFFWKPLTHPEDIAIQHEHELKLMHEGKTDFTNRIVTHEGNVRWLFNRVWRLTDTVNQIHRVEGVSTDITYIKQTEKIIMEQDLKLRAVFDSIDVALILLDTKGIIQVFNKVTLLVEKLWNVEIRQGMNFIDMAPQWRKKEISESFNQVLQSKQSLEYTIRYDAEYKGKNSVYLLIHFQPVTGLEGHVHQVCLMVRDVTEINLSEIKIQAIAESLRISNERYRLASFATNDAVWDRDLVTDDLYWGESYQRIFGHDPSQEPKDVSSWTRHIHPDDFYRVLKKVDDFLNNKREDKWEDEYWYRKGNGDYVRVFDRGYLIKDDSGKPVRMIGAMQDVTERTRDIEEIKKLSLVASKTENLVIITDPDENIEWVNEGFVRTTGYRLDQVLGKKPKEILQGPETNRSALDSIRKNLDLRLPVTEEVLNYTKEGKKIWLKMSINPIFDDNRKVTKFISVETDVTVQRDYADKITAIARDLSDLITNANAIIFGVDRNGYVNEWNKLTESLTGFTKNEALEKKLLDFLVETGERAHVQQMLSYALQGNPLSQYEFPIMNAEGKKLTILVNATLKRSAGGGIAGLLIVGQDITELTAYRHSLERMVKERTLELEVALENQKELATLKSRFASMVSHELRTPLSTIKLSVNHIKRYKERMSPEAIDEKIDMVQEQVTHMVSMLSDVLTLSKADENKIPVAREEVDIAQLLKQIALDVEQEHDTHEIVTLFDKLPERVFVDAGFVRNIFINLLTNAVKFSPNHHVVVFKASCQDQMLRVEVIDKGIGIDPEDQSKIFDAFHRGTNAHAIQGTGLGLSIVRRAVDRMDGSISVTSVPGQGSTFVVTIPLT